SNGNISVRGGPALERQHDLYFLPDPQGHGSLRPTFGSFMGFASRTMGRAAWSLVRRPFVSSLSSSSLEGVSRRSSIIPFPASAHHHAHRAVKCRDHAKYPEAGYPIVAAAVFSLK